MEKISAALEAGHIVRVCLDPTLGVEKKKERFCLVVEKGNSHLNLIIVLPITNDTGKRSSQFYVPLTNLKKAGVQKPYIIDCYQIQTISTERLVKNKTGSFAMGKIESDDLFQVRKRLSWILDIGEEHISL